jgi:hypothetical protein
MVVVKETESGDEKGSNDDNRLYYSDSEPSNVGGGDGGREAGRGSDVKEGS